MDSFKTRWMYFFIVVLFLAALGGCKSEPLPADKKNYAGEWRGSGITLKIYPDGIVDYKKVRGSSKTTINAPIKEFEDDNFIVGVWILTTTFVVQKTPFQEGERWAMVVDGNKLYRVDLPVASSKA